jgi:hypothetical protein
MINILPPDPINVKLLFAVKAVIECEKELPNIDLTHRKLFQTYKQHSKTR